MQPYEECPSFDRCSCNACPLDPDINKRISCSEDERCKANESTRVKIGSKYMNVLTYQGLTKRKFNARKVWHGEWYGKTPLVPTVGEKL